MLELGGLNGSVARTEICLVDKGGQCDPGKVLRADLRVVHVVPRVRGWVVLGRVVGVRGTATRTLEVVHGGWVEEGWAVQH